MRPALALAALTLLATPAAAQDAAPAPPACATEAAPYRDFDFWVGDWEVTDPDGVFQGENTVSSRDGGCLIVEEWTGAGGGEGVSLNFVDPSSGAWRQVWRGTGVVIDYEGGLDADGAMVLEGAIVYAADGRSAPFHGRWTARNDGSVLQEFWEQSPESGDWEVWFVGVYRPKSADDAP